MMRGEAVGQGKDPRRGGRGRLRSGGLKATEVRRGIGDVFLSAMRSLRGRGVEVTWPCLHSERRKS